MIRQNILLSILALLCLNLIFPLVQIDGETIDYEILNVYPHDTRAFTQGLVFYGDFLYEGTGLYGSSSVRKIDLASGIVLENRDLEAEFFGEGITIFQGKLIQLTWREKRGFVYDLESFEKLHSFIYKSEGWGLTTDGKHLIMSDGSSYLTYLDPNSFKPLRKIQVFDRVGPVKYLNELEFVHGQIYANVWLTNTIVIINPLTGEVLGKLDLEELTRAEKELNPQVDVLNGIAHDPINDRLFVTGKLWSNVYELKLILRNGGDL